MNSENWITDFESNGLELPKKRKSRKRGKQSRTSRETETESSDSNVFETDIKDNEGIGENTFTNKCKLNDDQDQIIVNDNENSKIKNDVILSQSSVENDTTSYLTSEVNNNDLLATENLGINNLVADNNKFIFTDTVSKNTMRGEQTSSAANTKKYEAVELGSEDLKTMYPPTPTTPSAAAAVPEEHVLYNSKALPKTAPTYQLEKFARNVLIIFNHKNFYGPEQRKGTEQDVKALTETFEAFDFDVLPYNDRTKEQIMEILRYVGNQDFSDYGCVGIAVLTHGNDKGELFAKDDVYTEMDIINSLKSHKNPSMITKPRLLIIQACRGTRAIAGAPVFRRGKIRTDLNYETEPYTLPVEADMLVLHSSYAGNPAHRHETEGTWLIQTLCKKINEMAPAHDLETILTEVKREVAVDKEHEVRNRAGGVDVNKQIPVVTSTLIRKLYLRKYDDSDENPPTSVQVIGNISVDAAHIEPTLDKCPCGLKYFSYIKTCLRYYVEDNPEDTGAQSLLELTETFNNEAVFDSAKEKCAVAISHHLDQNAKNTDYYKYLHIFRR